MQLVDITKENRWDVLCITTNETITVTGSGEPYEAKRMPSLCEEFVASNALSIVQSVYEDGWVIKAIEHEGKPIGFRSEQRCWTTRSFTNTFFRRIEQ